MLIYYPDWLFFTEHLCGKLLEGELKLMPLRYYPWLLAQSAWLCVCVDSTAVENTHMFFFVFFAFYSCIRTEIHKSIKTGRRGSVKEGVVCPHSTLKKPAFLTGACLVFVVTTRFFCLRAISFSSVITPTPSTFNFSITQYFNIHCQEIWLLWPSNLICIFVNCLLYFLIFFSKHFSPVLFFFFFFFWGIYIYFFPLLFK